jgi:aspartate/methionine/tyrosine aminotransferase
VGEREAVPDFTAVIQALDVYSRRTGRKPLPLGGWELDDSAVAPPEMLVERLAAIPARLDGYTYMRELSTAKQRAADALSYGILLEGQPLTQEQIAVVPNSTQALLLALAALKAQGVAHVVVAAPGYFAAVEACRHLGLTLTIVPAADFMTGALDSKTIVATMSGRPSVLIVTNPAYSIGVEYGWPCLRSLLAALPPESYVILDETRLGLHWDDEAPWYQADYAARVLVVRSPSKIFFINGLKTSIIFGAPDLIHSIEQLSEALLGSVAGMTEQVALAYFACWQRWVDELRAGEIGPFRTWRRNVVAHLKRSRRAVAAQLEKRGFTLSPVNSGPYLLAGIRDGEKRPVDSCAVARDTGVLLMDSPYFLHAQRGWLGFRVNLCARQEQLIEAIERVFPLESPEVMATESEELSEISLISQVS